MPQHPPKRAKKKAVRAPGEGGPSEILREQLRVLGEAGVAKPKRRRAPQTALGAPPPRPGPRLRLLLLFPVLMRPDQVRAQEAQSKAARRAANAAYAVSGQRARKAARRAQTSTAPVAPSAPLVPVGKRQLGPGFLERYGSPTQ